MQCSWDHRKVKRGEGREQRGRELIKEVCVDLNDEEEEKRSQWTVIVLPAWSLLLLPALWSWHCWGSWPHPCAVAATVAAVVISVTGIPVMSDNRHGNPWTLSQVYLRPMSEIRRNKNVIEWDQLSIEMSQEFIKWEVSKRQSVKRSVGVPRLSSHSRMEHFPPVCALTCLSWNSTADQCLKEVYG